MSNRIVINVYGGVVQDIFCDPKNTEVIVVDWDQDEEDDGEHYVTVKDVYDRPKSAYVGWPQLYPLKELVDTDAGNAVKKVEDRLNEQYS